MMPTPENGSALPVWIGIVTAASLEESLGSNKYPRINAQLSQEQVHRHPWSFQKPPIRVKIEKHGTRKSLCSNNLSVRQLAVL
jgi:hypothetical protein